MVNQDVYDALLAQYRSHYGKEPEVVAYAPGRITPRSWMPKRAAGAEVMRRTASSREQMRAWPSTRPVSRRKKRGIVP